MFREAQGAQNAAYGDKRDSFHRVFQGGRVSLNGARAPFNPAGMPLAGKKKEEDGQF